MAGNRPFSPTTLSIFEEVLKQVSNPPYWFNPRDIVDELGVSRQLTSNLLTRLVERGLLERDRGRYRVPEGQLPILIEYVVGASKHTENPNLRLYRIQGIFDKDTVDAVKLTTNVVLKAQSIKIEGYPYLKQKWIDRLEQAQAALKKEIKFLKSHTKTSANIDDETFDVVIEDIERMDD